MPIEKKTSFNSFQNGDTYKYFIVTIKLNKSLQKKKKMSARKALLAQRKNINTSLFYI